VALDNLPHVIEAETISAHVVSVTMTHTIELIKDAFLIFFGDADAIVAQHDNVMISLPECFDSYLDLVARIFDTVVDDVADGIADVHRVGMNGHIFG
jgi:hypothetical protein